jgi:ureidoacrylate peracid hydrolase
MKGKKMFKTFEEKVDPRHAAVIVVDVQNDFCHPQSPLASLGMDMSAAEKAAHRTAELIEAARSAGSMVVFVQYVEAPYTRSEMQLELRSRMRPGGDVDGAFICELGTWGADFFAVAPLPGEPVVVKHRYSAFINTDLDLILRSSGIKTLIMTGVATNVCVESTARDGYQRDYYVVFVDDCSACYNPDRHASTLANMSEVFGVVTSADEVMNAWQPALVGAG